VTVVMLVEDDAPLRRALSVTLRARGLEIVTAADGRSAIELFGKNIDLVLLDLGLPDMDGLQVVRRIRSASDVPVIVVSARRDQSEKVRALDAGADDYVTKPFGVDELTARIRAALRRSQGGDPAERVIETPDFHIDLVRKQVLDSAGQQVHLTPTEWGVLEVLVRGKGAMVSGQVILRDVWGPAAVDDTHYLRVYMAQLRRKLEPEPATPKYLLTVPGMGYIFDETGSGR
jgi:two-component system KDP operon response regulator KdpE